MAEDSTNQLEFIPRGVLEGHSDWVTQIISGNPQKENEDSAVLISGSRDKSLILWKMDDEDNVVNNTGYYGIPWKSFTGHNHFISDITLSSDNHYLISSSWDKTLRLWDLRNGKTTKRFTGHTKEVLSVVFSPDNRQILSAGCDREIRLWNTLADCKYVTDKSNHQDWVSCLRYSPLQKPGRQAVFQPYFASVGWDGRLKIWNTNIQIRASFKAHESYINALAISPNGRYVATGGKDRNLVIWDVTDLSKPSNEFDAGCTINQIAFNPKMQWVAAATEQGARVWDLKADKSTKPIAEIEADNKKDQKGKKQRAAQCTAISWNSLGNKLFTGFSDGIIRVHHVKTDKALTN